MCRCYPIDIYMLWSTLTMIILHTHTRSAVTDVLPIKWKKTLQCRSSGPAFMQVVYYMQVDTPVAGLLGGTRGYNKWTGGGATNFSSRGRGWLPTFHQVWWGHYCSPVCEATPNSQKFEGTTQVLPSVYRTAGPKITHNRDSVSLEINTKSHTVWFKDGHWDYNVTNRWAGPFLAWHSLFDVLYSNIIHLVRSTFVLLIIDIFNVRNGSCGKVMFSQACVKNSVHRRAMRGGWGGMWQGVCMTRGHAWQEKRPLQRTVPILL